MRIIISPVIFFVLSFVEINPHCVTRGCNLTPLEEVNLHNIMKESSKFCEFLLKVEFFSTLGTDHGNVAIPCYNVWRGLVEVYFGARDKTRAELGNLLGVSTCVDDELVQMLKFLDPTPGKKALTGVNFTGDWVIFLDVSLNKTELLERLLRDNKRLSETDFLSQRVESQHRIMAWLSHIGSHSYGVLKYLEDVEVLSLSAARLDVTLDNFYVKHSKNFSFSMPEGVEQITSALELEGHAWYRKSDVLSAELVTIKGHRGSPSLVLIKPLADVENVEQIVDAIDVDLLRLEMTLSEVKAITLRLPKIRFVGSLDLKDINIELGELSLLDPTRCDLRGYTSDVNSLTVRVVHTSSVTFDLVSQKRDERPRLNIESECDFNRPFIYLLMDTVHKNILFVGVVSTPFPMIKD